MCIPGFLDALEQACEDHFASISVLHRGRSHYHQHHQTEQVHNQMSLATPFIPVCVIASLLSTYHRFDALAVEYGSTWLFMPALLLSQCFSQRSVEAFPLTIDAPQPEVNALAFGDG